MQNFGKIKNTFNTLLVEGIADKSKENKAIFGQFVRAIKESKILKAQFNVYYDIEKKAEPNELKSSEFVKESISLLGQFKKEDIIAENKKLVAILEKYKINVLEDAYPTGELHENISNLIFTKKTSSSMDSIVESLEKVITHVKQNVVEVKEKTWKNEILPNSFVGNIMMEKFNNKYDDLTGDERGLVKSIVESDENGKKELLKNLTAECMGLINTRLAESDSVAEKEALLNVKEALLTMEYTNEGFIGDVSRIIELKKAFNE